MGHLTRYGYIALAYLHEKKNRIDLLKWKENFSWRNIKVCSSLEKGKNCRYGSHSNPFVRSLQFRVLKWCGNHLQQRYSLTDLSVQVIISSAKFYGSIVSVLYFWEPRAQTIKFLL